MFQRNQRAEGTGHNNGGAEFNSARSFFKELGCHTRTLTRDPQSYYKLCQQISVTIQRFNCLSIISSSRHAMDSYWIDSSVFISYFCLQLYCYSTNFCLNNNNNNNNNNII